MTYEEKKAIQKAIVMCDMNVIDGFYYWELLKALDKVPTENLPPYLCPHYQGGCGLDTKLFCYCSEHYEMCDKYKESICAL